MRNYSGGGSGVTTTPDIHAFYHQDAVIVGKRYYPCGVIYDEAMDQVAPIATGTIFATPLLSTRGHTIAGLHVRVTTAAAAGKVLRMGIYDAVDDTSNLYPNNLIIDCGTVLADSTGVKNWVANTALTPGKLYWVAALTDGALQVRAGRVWMFWNLLGKASPDTTTPGSWWWTATQAYGALPATFPTAGSTAVDGLSPSPCFFFSV